MKSDSTGLVLKTEVNVVNGISEMAYLHLNFCKNLSVSENNKRLALSDFHLGSIHLLSELLFKRCMY